MNRFWVIGNSKKVLFPGKSVFIFLLSYFCTLFSKNWLFATRPPFLNRWYLINGSFLSRVTFHIRSKRQKSCTLIVILVKCLYLTSPIFNSSAKSNRTFYGLFKKVIPPFLKKKSCLKKGIFLNFRTVAKNKKREKLYHTWFMMISILTSTAPGIACSLMRPILFYSSCCDDSVWVVKEGLWRGLSLHLIVVDIERSYGGPKHKHGWTWDWVQGQCFITTFHTIFKHILLFYPTTHPTLQPLKSYIFHYNL